MREGLVTQPLRELAVRRGLAEGDLVEQRPHLLLEIITPQYQRKVERDPLAGQVLLELPRGLPEYRIGREVDLDAQYSR
ncbi:hypothetical protein GCM10009744_00890 [Kribbella alba]|uniref:Uma2 family endonuclease n=1 Tax=Kribbella alba TaxID=190197 RepID=A0ABP4QPZ9_9ACTN